MLRIFRYFVWAVLVFGWTAPVAAQEFRIEIGDELSPSEIRRLARLFDEHIVRMGETGFSIARGYAISPLTLAEDNPGVDLANVRVGQVLLIRKRERGRTEPSQVAREWEAMMARATADEAAREARQAQQAQQLQHKHTTDLPPADTLWNMLDDHRGGDGKYPWEVPGRRPGLRDFSEGGVPHIALMLPLDQSGGDQFTDFYKGALIALEDLKAQGRSARMTVYNSENSAEKFYLSLFRRLFRHRHSDRPRVRG